MTYITAQTGIHSLEADGNGVYDAGYATKTDSLEDLRIKINGLNPNATITEATLNGNSGMVDFSYDSSTNEWTTQSAAGHLFSAAPYQTGEVNILVATFDDGANSITLTLKVNILNSPVAGELTYTTGETGTHVISEPTANIYNAGNVDWTDSLDDLRIKIYGLNPLSTTITNAKLNGGSGPFNFDYDGVTGEWNTQMAANAPFYNSPYIIGINNLTATFNDGTASMTLTLLVDVVESSILSETEKEIVIGEITEITFLPGSALDNISIPSSVSDDTSITLDFSQVIVGGDVTLTNGLTLSRETLSTDYFVSLPAGTIISGTGWTGVLNLPTIKALSSVTPTAISGTTASVSKVMEVGFGDVKLILDKPARILISGEAGKLAGYSRGGVFTAITTTCNADDETIVNTQLSSEGDCKVNVGSDLVIWTKHFTTFATYSTQTVDSNSNVGGSNGGGGYCLTQWKCTEWGNCVDGVQTRTCSYPTGWCAPKDTKPLESQECQVVINVSEITPAKGFFSTITGAVIGALSTPGGIFASVGFIVIIVGLMVTLRVGRKARKGKKKDKEEIN